MGNVLLTQRLVRAARSDQLNNSDYVSSLLELVRQRPALLRAKSAAVGGSIWHWAAEKGNVLLLEELIRFVTRTTVCRAAADIQQELQQQLNIGFDLDTTPLMLACKHGQPEAARTLLQHGADPHLVDRRGNNTCLHIAAFAGHTDVIKVILDTTASYPLLMETHPTPEAPPQQQQQQQPAAPPLVQAQQQPVQHVPAAAPLLNTGNIDGLTALHLSVCRGHAEAVQALLEAGASLSSSSRFPAHVSHRYLPARTTPLHVAVHARNPQCIVLLLMAHEQRYGGTAAARAQDPRLLSNGNGHMPYHLARRLRLPDSVCEMLYPLSPLREHLQQQQQQQPLLLCHSLQELAGAALKDALLGQLHFVAAAIGAANTDEQQQQQSEAASSAAAAAAAAAAQELSLMLQDSVMACVSITHSESLCVKLGTKHNSQPLPSPAPPAAEAAVEADWQALLDVVRFHILCHGVCDPGDPASCWFADACHTCTAVACTNPGNNSSCSSSHGVKVGLGVGIHCTDPSTGEGCCPAEAGPNSGRCVGGGSSSMGDSSNAVGVADYYSGSLGDLQCSVMPAEQCSRVPGAALLDHSRLLPLLRGIKSSCVAGWSVLQVGGSWREACGVCFEEEQGLLLQLRPCKHVLCLSCVQLLVSMIGSKPALCPFCRGALAGVQVHVGEHAAVEAARPQAGAAAPG